MKSLILKLHKQIIQGDTTITQIINDAILKCKKHDITASLITDNYQTAQKKAQELQEHISLHKDDLLYGIPYVLKDNVCTKNLRTTAGSAFLSDFIPPYNATIYELFNANHAVLIAKSNMDEFGMGGSGIHSAYGIVKNIHDHNFTVGGSSSGSVNLVANQVVPFAIGSDTGDSSRRPASFTNTTGYKPTYGLISRYGMMPYAPSLDHVGIIASFVADIAIVAQAIVKFDEKDFTSQKVKNNNFFNNLKQVDKLTIGVISGIEKYLQPEIASAYTECLKKLKEHKFVIKPIEIKNEHLVAIKTIYSIISYAEANSCWANLTGLVFGNRSPGKDFEDMITLSRTQKLGDQVKRRFVIGAYVTKKENYVKYFIRAQKIRQLLVNEWNQCLKAVDTVLLPSASSKPPLLSDILNDNFKSTVADDILCLSNFAGSPSITIPYTQTNKKLLWGINLNCEQFADQQLLNIAYTLETFFDGNKDE